LAQRGDEEKINKKMNKKKWLFGWVGRNEKKGGAALGLGGIIGSKNKFPKFCQILI
jgi:hypothetical protein